MGTGFEFGRSREIGVECAGMTSRLKCKIDTLFKGKTCKLTFCVYVFELQTEETSDSHARDSIDTKHMPADPTCSGWGPGHPWFTCVNQSIKTGRTGLLSAATHDDPDRGMSGALRGNHLNMQEKRHFIARNWRGEFPLWISYWGFGVFVTIALWTGFWFFSEIYSEFIVYHPISLFGWFAAVWTLTAVVTVWQLVGIWRAAGRLITDRRRAGKRAFWAWTARVMVGIGALRFLGILSTVAAPQLAEGVRMAFLNDPEIPDYALRLMNEETEIEIIGGIKYGLDRDLRQMLEAAPRVRVIHLDSVGGRQGEAAKLYRTIRDQGLDTHVANECLSACGNVFIGGRERWISRSGKLGFHRGAFPGLDDDLVDEEAVFGDVQIRESGISREFVSLAAKVANKDMWYPKTEELLRYKVVTGIADDWQFALSGIGGDYTREQFENLLRARYPVIVPFSALEPQEYDRLLDEYHQGYLNGKSAGALVRAYEQRILTTAYTYLALAGDSVLRDYLTQITKQFRYLLENHEPVLCAGFISGNLSLARSKLPGELMAREVEILEQVFFTVSPRSPAPDEALAPDWDRVAEKTYERVGNDDYNLIWQPAAPAGREQAYCKAVIAYYEEILKLPVERTAELVRAMVRK